MSFDGISFGAFVGSLTVAHDEVRLGESWADVTVPAIAQPAITSQPRAATTSFAGGTVVLTAEASGQPLPTYQWFKGVDPISGQTSATLTLTNVQTTDTGAYHLTATNSQGSATTNNAQVNVVAAPAGLLVYEGFDYDTGPGVLPGKAGGLGWGAAWTNINAGGGTILSNSLTAGTNAPNGYDAQSLGNDVQMANGRRDGRLVDTSPGGRLGTAGYIDGFGNVGADGKTVYLSFLQQPDGTSKFYEFEFHRDNLGDPGRIAGIGNDTANPIVNLRAPNGAQSLIGTGSTGVNFYVVRIDFKAGNDDVFVYQNPVSAAEPGTPTLTKLAVSDMSFDGFSIAAFDNLRTVKHDEIRLGQNWSDVVFGTSRLPLTWVGDGTNNNWNFTDANWNDGTGATPFTDGNPVTFNDNGSDSPAVNVTTAVSTGSVTVTNDTKNYTIGGTGTINCSGGLAKSGNGSLVLTGTSGFSAAAVVNGGTLSLNGTTTAGGGLNANAGVTNLGGTNSLGGLISTSGNLSITGPTTITGAGAYVWIGNFPGANSSLTIEPGGSLDMSGALADSWVIGRDGGIGSVTQNGGTVTYNPPNRPDIYVGASLSAATNASYTITAGTLEMSAKRLTIALGPITANLNQSGGTINVNQLQLGQNLMAGNGTGIFELTGGVINIGAAGITAGNALYQVNLRGGTLGAAANWNSSLAMKLINPVTFDTASHVITLSGGLTDLDAETAPGALVKNGSGTLVLSGFNDYTGPTTVSQGTVAGNGNQSSAFTVATGATIAPGAGGIGNFLCDSTDFANGSTLAIEINSTTQLTDQLVSFNGAIDIDGASVSFTEIGTGFLPAETVLVLVESATAVTGTFTGYADGAEITIGSNTFTLDYTPTQVTLTSIGSPYTNWAFSKGLDGTPGKDPAFDADPEQDGMANGLEWILGGDPLASDAGTLVTTTASEAGGLTLEFTREEDSLGSATLVIEWDDNLDGTWTQVEIDQDGGSYPNGVTVGVDEIPAPDDVTVNIPAANGPDGKVFARLRAILP